jgi:hypothetical protein
MNEINPYEGFANFYPLIDSGSYGGGLSFLKGKDGLVKLNNEEAFLWAYNNCPPLKAIIGKRGKYFNVAKIDIYDKKKNEPAKGLYADSIRTLLKRPNPLQTGKQFFAQQNAYLDLFGWCAVLEIKPFGMDKISAMWNIPPWLLTPKYETETFWNISDRNDLYRNFSFKWKNDNITFDKENIKVIFDDGFGTDNNMDLTIPDSRLKGEDYNVSNIVAALTATNTGITRRGPTGILSNNASDSVGHIPMMPGEKESVQKDFKRYGVTGQEYQVIITEANLSWQQMGSSLKDMELPVAIGNSVRSLCDSYGWPPELIAGTNADINYENKEHAKKDAYTGTIIPESESRWEQRTDGLITDPNLELRGDFSKVPILQEDRLLTAQVRETQSKSAEKEFRNNLITHNQWLVLIGYEPRTDAFGEKYYFELLALGWTFGNTTLSGGDTMVQQGK